jgi:hypothetical protein
MTRKTKSSFLSECLARRLPTPRPHCPCIFAPRDVSAALLEWGRDNDVRVDGLDDGSRRRVEEYLQSTTTPVDPAYPPDNTPPRVARSQANSMATKPDPTGVQRSKNKGSITAAASKGGDDAAAYKYSSDRSWKRHHRDRPWIQKRVKNTAVRPASAPQTGFVGAAQPSKGKNVSSAGAPKGRKKRMGPGPSKRASSAPRSRPAAQQPPALTRQLGSVRAQLKQQSQEMHRLRQVAARKDVAIDELTSALNQAAGTAPHAASASRARPSHREEGGGPMAGFDARTAIGRLKKELKEARQRAMQVGTRCHWFTGQFSRHARSMHSQSDCVPWTGGAQVRGMCASVQAGHRLPRALGLLPANCLAARAGAEAYG